MENKIKNRLIELTKRDEIEVQEAVDFLREVSGEYLAKRGEYLRNKQLKDAKVVHDELGKIYSMVARKILDEDVKKSLEEFVNYWYRSGETEIFIEPSLPKKMVKPTEKSPIIQTTAVSGTVVTPDAAGGDMVRYVQSTDPMHLRFGQSALLPATAVSGLTHLSKKYKNDDMAVTYDHPKLIDNFKNVEVGIGYMPTESKISRRL